MISRKGQEMGGTFGNLLKICSQVGLTQHLALNESSQGCDNERHFWVYVAWLLLLQEKKI